jgi:anti-anti-sigma factor
MHGRDAFAARAGARSRLAKIERREDDDVFTVAVSGELDISNVEALRDAAMTIPNSALGLVVDLSATEFIDSATVGLLFELQQSLPRRGQALRVVCPPGTAAERVLAMMSFDGRVRDRATTADAIAAIRREVRRRP